MPRGYSASLFILTMLLALPLNGQQHVFAATDTTNTWTGTNTFSTAIINNPFGDWRHPSIGPVGFSGDQTANITKAWNATNTSTGLLPVGNMLFSTAISPAPGKGHYSEECADRGNGGLAGGCTFVYTGSAGIALDLDRQRDSYIGGFSIQMGSATTGLNIRQSVNSLGISSHNFYHDIQVNGVNGVGSNGVAVVPLSADNGNNNEAHTFWRLGVSATTFVNPGSNCFFLGQSANARDIGLYESEMNGCGTGFQLGGGSWHVLGGLTEAHNVTFSIGGSQGGTAAFVHDESSKQGIKFSASSQYQHIFFNNTWETDNPDLTAYYWDFGTGSFFGDTVLTIGNNMKPNASVTKMVNPKMSGLQWISIADDLPNLTIANLPNLATSGRSTIMIGTPNPYTGGNFSGNANKEGIAIFESTPKNSSGDQDDSGAQNGLWIGATTNAFNLGAGDYISSPAFTMSGLYIPSGGGSLRSVPFRYKVLLSDGTGTSAATWKLMPPTDPVTGTTYPGPLNFDYKTNGSTFSVKNLDATTVASGGGSANHATCWKSDGKTLGYCSTQPDSTGSCTCN